MEFNPARRAESGSTDVNKIELAAKVSERTGLTRAHSLEVVESIFSSADGEGIIVSELDADRSVSIAGFGKFETRRRSSREGRNPATGESIQIAAKRVVAFKPAKGLKDRFES